MDDLAVYNGEAGIFNFNEEALRKGGIELNVLRGSNLDNSASQVTLDILIFKALTTYFKEEKVISFDSISCYEDILKKSSKMVEIIKSNKYFLPPEINPYNFSQKEIMEFHQKEKFNPLLGMLNFISRKYNQKKEK